MTVLTPPGYVQGGTYTARLDRVYGPTHNTLADGAVALGARQGFLPGRAPAFSNPSGWNVTLGACAGVIANGFASGAGDYAVANDGPVGTVVTASSPTLNRQDIVGFQVKDHFYDGSTLNEVVPAVVQGSTSAGASVDPPLPSSFIPVLRAVVAAGSSAPVLQSLVRYTTAPGGTLRVDSVAERDALVPWPGLRIYRSDRFWEELYDTAWRVQSVAICSSVADRNSAVTSPRSGQFAVTTDTDTLWQYDGATASWITMGSARAPWGELAHVPNLANVALPGGETIISTASYVHTVGRKEHFAYAARFSLNASGNLVVRFRISTAGGAAGLGSTIVYETIPRGDSNNNNMTLFKRASDTIRNLPSGTYQVIVTATPAAGAASGTVNGDVTGVEGGFTITDAGGA